MTILYLDGASGVSGDMILGALVDLGLDPAVLRSRLALLPIEGCSITARRVRRAGFGARKVDVKVSGRQPHRGLADIRRIIEKSRLDPGVKRQAMAIFTRIVGVEARIHGIPRNRVHLHEVGAVDAIADIVGAVVGVREILGDGGRLICSPLNVGRGTVRMAHGLLPVPAPATAALLEGVPVYSDGPPAELVTPTGAAIVTALASSFGPPPPMVIARVGYGAGGGDYEGHPNVLRAILGEPWPGAARAQHGVTVVECTIDDMNPQTCGYLMERLFGLGALEVFYTPVQMKKDRPGVLVTVVCESDALGDVARAIFEETTTIGLRYRAADRLELDRSIATVRTRFGRIRVKVATLDGRVTHVQPEYEDCRKAAARRRVPLKEVQAAARAAYGETA